MSSVVQSTPFSVPPASSLEAITGRTSVLRLRESFDLGLSHSKDILHESNHDRASVGTSQGRKLTLHSPLDDNDNREREAWQCMGVLEEHPAEDSSGALAPDLPSRSRAPGSISRQGGQMSSKQPLHAASSASGEIRSNDRVQTSALAHLLDGTSPEAQTARNAHWKGKRTFAGLLRQQRQAAKSSEGSRGPQQDTSSPDSPSKASLLCSRLPQFRRESGPSAAMKDKISMFEGLVTRENDRTQLNGASGGSNEPTCRLPSKFRGAHRNVDKGHGASANAPSIANSRKPPSEASVTAGQSSMQLRTGRRESGHDTRQRTGETDQPSFFKRVSSTFKHKHKPSQQYLPVPRSSRAGVRDEKERTQISSPGSESTHQDQSLIQSEKRQMLAADSLRKRLEAELGSAPDMNGHPDIQAGPVQTEHVHQSKEQQDPLPVSQSHQESEGHPIVHNRRKTTLWNMENPFDVPTTASRSKSDAAGIRLGTSGEGLSGHTEIGDFANVALAPILSIQDRPGTVGEDTATSGSSDLVVVANADCSLTHPRPSRSSDKNMIKVLCGTGGDRGSSDSEESSSSFYTAPVSTSGV